MNFLIRMKIISGRGPTIDTPIGMTIVMSAAGCSSAKVMRNIVSPVFCTPVSIEIATMSSIGCLKTEAAIQPNV